MLLVLTTVIVSFAACNGKTPAGTDPTHQHVFGEWVTVKEPNCTEKGENARVCECGERETEEIAVNGEHVYDYTVKSPTTEEGGYTTYTCSRCGDSYVDDYVEALGHDYDAVVTEPTCEEGGYTTYTCTNCGDSYVGDYTDPVGHSYEEGSCVWCGEDEMYYRWISATTSLNGTIDLNIYVALSDNILNDPDAFVRFEHSGVTVDVPVSEGLESVKNGITCYRYSCEIFAKQVADTVIIQVMNENGAISNELEYSVMKYCVNQINKSSDEKLVAVCKAMLNYAAAAQTYFNYNTDNLANASLNEADKVLPEVDASAYALSVEGSESGLKPSSATLMLESEVKIRIYFAAQGGASIDDYTYTIDGKEVPIQYNEKNGRYYIESDGIAAKELDNMHVFCGGNITVNYGALSYVNSKLTSKDPKEVNLVKALYAYYAAAEALLG
jgi:DNA-directed RNA polymerase subunit RPC12/RpoP